jgi:sortase A
VLSSLQEAHGQHNAYALFREELTQLSQRTAPLGGTIAPDSPVALVNAPQIGVRDVVILEGTASGDLARGPGHKRNTPLPGQAGTSVVYGRANLFGGPFGRITRATPGDAITVTTGQGVATYRIEEVRRPGDPLPISLQPGEGRLTLVSSEGGSWLNGFTPERPVYVDAMLQGKTFDTPPGRPIAVPRSENSMKGDVGALFSVVLWLPLLILAGLAAVWAQAYWGRWHTWLIGAPVILAALWGVSETAVQLLPNLM